MATIELHHKWNIKNSKKFLITKADYDMFMAAKNNGTFASIICDAPCKLGKTKNFKVKDSELSIELQCISKGAFFTGGNCFSIPN